MEWQWGPNEEDAFRKIKELLTSAPVLGFPDFKRAFILHTDASGYGVGGILSQLRSSSVNPGPNEEPLDGSKETVIAYTSRHLTETQMRWSTTEKEAYAIMPLCKDFLPLPIRDKFYNCHRS